MCPAGSHESIKLITKFSRTKFEICCILQERRKTYKPLTHTSTYQWRRNMLFYGGGGIKINRLLGAQGCEL